ncbi:MAG: winged helix-turn-helix domain-containing protein [Alphaproteobacteria bacterium]|nr:winged helix-turn-helix domain-containing protein [Alphaproteobacteria bacterium]
MTPIPLTTGSLDLGAALLRRHDGAEVGLTSQEVGLMAFLVARPHQDVEREELLSEVLGYRRGVRSRAVDDAMKRLRQKVERLPARPYHLVGVRGVGYRFVPLEANASLGVLRLGRYEVDLERLEARSEAGMQSLSAIEGRLLEVLAQHDGKPVKPETLLREVWGVHRRDRRRLVTKAIYRLRQKLEDDPGAPAVLRTLRGKGLVLEMSGRGAPRATLRPGRGVPPRVEVLGREAELRRARALLEPADARVTLHGPGGIGKSTLARFVAATREGPSVHVDLHEVRDPSGLAQAVAAAAGVDSERWDRVRASLATQPALLLVLDNADTALDAVRQGLAELPGVRVLVTSRQPLGLPGERVVAVGPLREEVARQLVLDRAAAAGLELDRGDPRLSALVTSLQGVPLALELAAARLRLLGPDGVVERLNRPLELLRSRQGGRHATMQAAIELSTDLLSRSERQLLAACTVFPGSFSVDAAEAVCAAVVEGFVVDGVEALLDHALLRTEGAGRLRLGLAVADVVRTWPETGALERTLAQRHLAWCAGLWAPAEEQPVPTPEQHARLRQEVEGARVAIGKALARGEREGAARCALWVVPVLVQANRGRAAEQLLASLGEVGDLDHALQIEVHHAAVHAYSHTTDVRTTRQHLRRLAELAAPDSYAGCRALGGWLLTAAAVDREERARLLQELDARIDRVGGAARRLLVRTRGWVKRRSGDLRGARQDLEAALEAGLQGGGGWELATVYKYLAIVAETEGRLEEAEGMLEMRWRHIAPAISREEDAEGLIILVRIREGQGQLAEALALNQDQLLQARTRGHRGNITHLLGAVANTLAVLGRLDEAMAAYTEALGHAHELGSRELIASLTLNMGEVSSWMGQPDRALLLLGEASRLLQENGERAFAALGRVLQGRVLLLEGQADDAEPLFIESIRILEGLGRSHGLAEAWLGWAQVAALRGDREAVVFGDKGEALARAHAQSAELAALLAWRGLIATICGETERARRLQEESAGLVMRFGVGPRSGAGLALARLRAALA